jgi:hypothetical protein
VDFYWHKGTFYGGEVTLTSDNFLADIGAACTAHVWEEAEVTGDQLDEGPRKCNSLIWKDLR